MRPRGGVELLSPGWGCVSRDAGCSVQSERVKFHGAVYHISQGLRGRTGPGGMHVQIYGASAESLVLQMQINCRL